MGLCGGGRFLVLQHEAAAAQPRQYQRERKQKHKQKSHSKKEWLFHGEEKT